MSTWIAMVDLTLTIAYERENKKFGSCMSKRRQGKTGNDGKKGHGTELQKLREKRGK